MKKTKLEKGITLIALIITIIILLILAVVTIGSIQDSNIITYAQNASKDYDIKKNEEESKIFEYEKLIGESIDCDKDAIVMPIAKVNAIVEENSTINGKMYGSANPIIPAGFKAINIETLGHTSYWDQTDAPQVDEGLVIEDDDKNQFVWIPVETLSEFAEETTGIDENSRKNYEGVLYDFNGITATEKKEYGQSTTSYREPANYEEYDTTSYLDIWTENLYQESFNAMVESVSKYKGFYVGRYETSLNGTTGKSKAEENPMNSMGWFDIYKNSLAYSENNTNLGVVSQMIWGCQYDAMLRFILTGDEADHVTNVGQVSHNNGDIYNTGGTGDETYSDIASNIYDLEGNVMEWTQEANTPVIMGTFYGRVTRGGTYEAARDASYRSGLVPFSGGRKDTGSRMTLYVK